MWGAVLSIIQTHLPSLTLNTFCLSQTHRIKNNDLNLLEDQSTSTCHIYDIHTQMIYIFHFHLCVWKVTFSLLLVWEVFIGEYECISVVFVIGKCCSMVCMRGEFELWSAGSLLQRSTIKHTATTVGPDVIIPYRISSGTQNDVIFISLDQMECTKHI